jgi:hypothetical protein
LRPLTYGTFVEDLYTMPVAGAALANTTTRTLLSLTSAATAGAPLKIPADFFQPAEGVSQGFRVELGGVISNTATPAFTFAAALDTTQGTFGTALAATGAFTTASGLSNAEFTAWFDCICTGVGTGGSLAVIGSFNVGAASNAATTAATTYMIGSSAGVAINTRVDNYLEIWGTWGAASASNTVTLQTMIFFGLN